MTRYSSNSRAPRRGRVSAGLLMYRWLSGELEVFLARPGGPWFPHRQHDIWTIPKGEVETGENLIGAAVREFQEEVGLPVTGPLLELGAIRQRGGKTVHAWAFEGDWDPRNPLQTSLVEIEWPPGSGEWSVWPEIDQAAFFTLSAARDHMKLAQQPFLDRLLQMVLNPADESNRTQALSWESSLPAVRD
ncbi:MAG: NUDIX domain-containing protein [Verrucomicrobia bacterium]|nr:NUDIX domain-containing protein [Verrucomicrobiota bacterium]